MNPIVDWYLTQLATYGLLPVLAVETAICVAAWCALGTALHAAERRRIRRTPAAPDNQPGRDPHLLWTCRRIAALPTTTATRKEKP